MFSRLKKLFKHQSYYGFIEPHGHALKVTCVDVKTEQKVPELSFVVKEKYQTIKEFIEEIPKIFGKHFKAVTLNVFNFEDQEFSNNSEICEAIKVQLDAINVPYYFIQSHAYKLTCLFSSTNITANLNDIVKTIFTENDRYLIGEFLFTENGYEYVNEYYVNANQDAEILRKEILGTVKSVKILASALHKKGKNKEILRNLKSVMQKSDCVVFAEFEYVSTQIQGIVEISKWILDKNYLKFHFLPGSRREYLIVGKVGDKSSYGTIVVKINSLVPCEKQEYIPRSNVECTLEYSDYNHSGLMHLESIPNYKNCHFSLITVNIDINNFCSYTIQPFINPQIEYLPVYLNEIKETKLPIIGFFDNLSVICVYKNGEYEFADQWNGVLGKELLISFAEEKPKFCENAIEDSKTKPSFVVFDIAPIMTMPIDNIRPELHWCFSFTKDSENPILIEFDNFDGKKTAASPSFLMAMLLKEHLKAIKNESGKKPKEIAFCFFHKLDDHQKSRIQDGLKEACKLLKVECHFIKNDL